MCPTLRQSFIGFILSLSVVITVINTIINFNIVHQKDFDLIKYKSSGHFLPIKSTRHYKNNVINPHNFNFILNPANICGKNKGQNLTLICLITVAADKFIERQNIRDTWYNKTMFPEIRAVFMTGLSKDTKVNEILANESRQFNDIVQESFMDTYTNLTFKTIMGFKWVLNFCSNAKFALKIDDDIVPNMPIILNYFKNLTETKSKYTFRSYIGFSYPKNSPFRNKSSKYYVSYDEFADKFYPPFNSGPAYLFTPDLAEDLYNFSLYTKYFRLEDIYTGVLMKKAKAKILNIAYKYLMKYRKPLQFIKTLNKTTNRYFFAYTVSLNEFKEIWNALYDLNYN